MSYSEAIAEAYASAPVDTVTLDTIELYHPAFIDDFGAPTAIRLVRQLEDWLLKLEVGAIIGGGTYVKFLACEFDVTLPEFTEDGGTPRIQLSIGNVSREITRYLEQAKQSLVPITVTYRPYLSTDTSGPQMDPPFVLEMSEVDVDVFQATGSATLEDIHNKAYPNEKYTTQTFPGLRR